MEVSPYSLRESLGNPWLLSVLSKDVQFSKECVFLTIPSEPHHWLRAARGSLVIDFRAQHLRSLVNYQCKTGDSPNYHSCPLCCIDLLHTSLDSRPCTIPMDCSSKGKLLPKKKISGMNCSHHHCRGSQCHNLYSSSPTFNIHPKFPPGSSVTKVDPGSLPGHVTQMFIPEG